MIIVQMSGGMGNQMFQYALYCRLCQLGYQVKLDDRSCYQEETARPKRLGVFPAPYLAATGGEIDRMRDRQRYPWSLLRRRIFGRKSKDYQEKSMEFDPQVLTRDPAYLIGCFQSERYFAEVKKNVMEAFSTTWYIEKVKQRHATEVVSLLEIEQFDRVLELREEIRGTDSVAIHIRRGDYLAEDVSLIYGGICTLEYYQAAMEYIRQRRPNAEFYCFSNDIEWVRENVKGDQVHYVDLHDEEGGHWDFILMCACHHFIIANSSYSWWASYLGLEEETIVVAPSRWLGDRECVDIYRSDMIVIDERGNCCESSGKQTN